MNLPTARPEDCSVLSAISSRGIRNPHQRIPIGALIADFGLHAQSHCIECEIIAAWDELHEGEDEL